MLAEWNAKFETGIQEVDLQHQVLFDNVNRLYADLNTGRDRQVLDDVFLELVVYVGSHFGTEERLMEESSYPGLAKHRIEHQRLTEKVKEYRALFEAGADLEEEMFEFLLSWLVNHILETDMQMGRYFRAHRGS